MNVRLVLTGLCAFFWGGFATPISIRLARQFCIMDLPDPRKVHNILTPRGAGLVLWTGYLLWSLYFVAETPFVKYSATGATLIFFCGYLDDMKSMSPFARLAAHIAASALVVFSLPLPPFSRALCCVWITGTTSAYNLIDGVDGLCISVFIASAVALCFVGGSPFGVAGAAMALGVFCWNFPKARTFLGDGGSTLLGFLFASHFVAVSASKLAVAAPHEAILLLLTFGGVPVLDTLIAFCRRILRGKSPFYPDRGHLHHRLMDLTGSPLRAVVCLLLVHGSFLFCGGAVYARLP